jgi:uncharacterized membrane protein YhaH (DUF805 family)
MVSYSDAMRSGVERFAELGGRSTRAEFWWWWLTASLISTITEGTALNAPIILVLFIPTFTLLVRRLHDTGRSAWSLLFFLIPAVGLFILIYFLVQPSDAASNRFGPPSPTASGSSGGGSGRAAGAGGWRSSAWDGGDPGPQPGTQSGLQGGPLPGPQGGAGGWPHGDEEPPRSSGWDDLPPPPPPSR